MLSESKLKKIVKDFLPPVVFRLVMSAFNLNRKYKGLYQLDKKIEAYVNYDNGYFVELGANDGYTQSNTYYFEKNRGWTGVLVEPIPHNYLICLNNRSPKTKVFCNACTSFSYREKFVEIAFSNLMSTPIGLESDISNPLEHAKSGVQFLHENENNFLFGAIAKPLNDILNLANAPKQIDFLSLDVEGAEIEVLKGIDHSSYRFNYLCIETRNKDKITHYLEKHGYVFLEQLSVHDFLYKDDILNRPKD
jgi:FkbM family methyltransferase